MYVATTRMRSPTRFAGLRRIDTSCLVASPQRVPAVGGRLRASDVVSVIDKIPPARDCLRHRRDLAVANLGEHPVAGHCTREHRYSRLTPISASTDRKAPRVRSGYAAPERVSSRALKCLIRRLFVMPRRRLHRLRRSPTARHARRCGGERDAQRRPRRDPVCRPRRAPCRASRVHA